MSTRPYSERREYHAAYYQKRKDELRARAALPEMKARKRASHLARKEAYRLRHNERNRAWRIKNAAKVAALTREYQARRQRAVPRWANRSEMDQFYESAREATKNTGIAHHVDHIIPLRSDIVCGLHVEYNLQILASDDNVRKGNRYWPDHPNG